MQLSHITISGFKSFAKKTTIDVTHHITGVVGPNGSGKSNIAEAIRFVLGEQSMKSMRGKIGADVIFKGSEHLSPLSRATVTMVITNRKNAIKKDTESAAATAYDTKAVSDTLAPYLVYDELTLSRSIYADGTSDYTLNDAKVRLKDVQELLSYAGIGSSSHTIINQGEADRILLSSPKDRKEALEDALGLRVYHMRIGESTRKLLKVKNHVREVELLRTEIKPHLLHLQRQVEKIEQQEEEKKKLFALLIAYFHKEEKDLTILHEKIQEQGTSDSLHTVVESIQKELALLQEKDKVRNEAPSDESMSIDLEKERIQKEMQVLTERKTQISKTLGRLEGERSYIEKELAHYVEVTEVRVPIRDLKARHITMISKFTALSNALEQADIAQAFFATNELSTVTHDFFNTYTSIDTTKKESLEQDITRIIGQVTEYEATLTSLVRETLEGTHMLSTLDSKAKHTVTTKYEEEKKVVLLESKLRELKSLILLRTQEEGEIALRKEHYDALRQEGVMILGRAILEYKDMESESLYKEMKKQDLMRAIERSKLRIEEASVPNKEETIAEYTTTKERDEYLTRELADIVESEKKLLALIEELTHTLSTRFASGVEEISRVFGTFFGEVFIGGKARLILVTSTKINEEGLEIQESGIDLDVSLPNKKVKEIGMFSGGERTLVSIALLFAMSSVTPPPFMVLDETDAPLDESNARKYGQMLARLSKNSKLLVITHNRETMNHCDMLYGVTIGVEGGSKLLSINFKEAEGYVK